MILGILCFSTKKHRCGWSSATISLKRLANDSCFARCGSLENLQKRFATCSPTVSSCFKQQYVFKQKCRCAAPLQKWVKQKSPQAKKSQSTFEALREKVSLLGELDGILSKFHIFEKRDIQQNSEKTTVSENKLDFRTNVFELREPLFTSGNAKLCDVRTSG